MKELEGGDLPLERSLELFEKGMRLSDTCRKRLEEAAEEGGPRVSKQPGAYNKARQELSLPVVEQCCDHAFRQLIEQAELAPDRRAAFFFDGTTVRMPHCEELAAAYPPTANQHGVAHWPLLRLLVAHDLYTGLALRPQWGPVNGSGAVSEQGLLEKLIERLPSAAIWTRPAG